MERLKKRKRSFTSMIITGIIIMGVCMLTFSLLLLMILQILGRNGAFSSAIFVKMEFLIAIGYFLFMIGFIWGVSYMVAKKIRSKGRILIDVVDKIRNQKLDFEIQLTGVTEIDRVLLAMNQMKDELANSLEAQWKMEQIKQKQLSALVHDLKTPITVLEGNLYLLNYEKISDEGKKSVEDMTQCVREMNEYVTQLLEISRENLQGDLIKKACKLNDLVDEVLQTMDVLFKQKRITVEKIYQFEQAIIFCDKKEMKRAIENVVSNALDFSPENSIIRMEITGNNQEVVLSVIDSGKGFSGQDLVNAKEQFYMGDASRGRRNHFGLGLSITENIVNAHEGVLEIANKPDYRGGIVSMKLPVLQ